jgi:hypothetical protein
MLCALGWLVLSLLVTGHDNSANFMHLKVGSTTKQIILQANNLPSAMHTCHHALDLVKSLPGAIKYHPEKIP